MNRWLTVALLVISGCSTTTMTVQKMRPAEVDMGRYHSILVTAVEGDNGSFTESLARAILNSGKFKVVDSGASDAILTGEMSDHSYNQTNDSKAGTCFDGKQTYDCYAQKVIGNWSTKASIRLKDTRSKSLVASKALSADKVKNHSVNTQDNTQYPDPDWDVNSVFSDLEGQMIADFMRSIAPYSVPVQVELYTDSGAPGLERGVEYAKHGDWNNAIQVFRDAATQVDSSPDAKAELKARCHYNYGIALGYSGTDFTGADRELATAISIKPTDVYYKERTKIQGFKHDDDALKKQETASAPKGHAKPKH
ncbi:MAG TPA: hypothetical protein VGK20_10890 [Candidatus Binatia bacterium]|jgi:hypothetical protein